MTKLEFLYLSIGLLIGFITYPFANLLMPEKTEPKNETPKTGTGIFKPYGKVSKLKPRINNDEKALEIESKI